MTKTRIKMVFYDGDKIYILYYGEQGGEMVSKLVDGEELFSSRCG